tara:strand:- start:290 stop:736 length:447 start_codon:yes stop_codon:yes gene_type:complete
MLLFLLQTALIVLCTSLAFWRGRSAEKFGSLILLTSAVVDKLYHLLIDMPVHDQVDVFHLTLDITAFVAAYALALKADRLWPMPFASALLLSVFAHLARSIDSDMAELVYAIMARAPFWLSIAILLVGISTNARLYTLHAFRRWRESQ